MINYCRKGLVCFEYTVTKPSLPPQISLTMAPLLDNVVRMASAQTWRPYLQLVRPVRIFD